MAEEKPILLDTITIYGGREYGGFIYYPGDIGSGVIIDIAAMTDQETILSSSIYSYEDYAKYRLENPQIDLPRIDPPETGKGNGNTIGKVAGQPEPSDTPADESNPPIEAETEQEADWFAKADAFLNDNPIVEVGSYVPFVGGAIEGGRAASAIWRGDYLSAAGHLANVLPIGKWAGALFRGGKSLFRLAKGKKAAKEHRKGKKSQTKGKLACGKSGKHGEIKNLSADGKYHRDHIPSVQALLEKAQIMNGGIKLTTAQKNAIKNWGQSVAIPRRAHEKVSPTYGGRNTAKDVNGKTLAQRDALNLEAAARRDIDVMTKEIDKYEKGCKSAYRKATKSIKKMKNKDYEDALEKILSEN